MKLQESLKAFVDGETRAEETALIRKQLEEHPEMQKEIDDLNRLSTSIREYVTQPEPVGLEATLAALEKAPSKSKSASRYSYQLRWIGGFAAAVVFVGVVSTVIFPVFAQSKEAAKKSTAISEAKARALAGEMNSSGDSSVAADRPASPISPGQFGNGDGTVGSSAGARAAKGEGMSSAKVATASPMAGGRTSDMVRDNIQFKKAASGAAESRLEQQPQPASGTSVPPSTHATPPSSRTLIQKTASLSVKVKNVAESQQTVEGIAVSLGGFVQQSNRNEAEGQKGEANLTVRVPVQQYDSAIKRIRGLGDVLSDSSTGNDVTADVVDMDARMKVLRAEESDYMAILGRARSIAAIMEIKDKLTQIREEIESIDSQRKSTKDLATYSTINVQLTQRGEVEKPKPEEDQGWLTNTWSTAVDGLSAAGKVIAQLFIFVLVWAPLWIPVALLSSWLYRKNRW